MGECSRGRVGGDRFKTAAAHGRGRHYALDLVLRARGQAHSLTVRLIGCQSL